MASSSQLNAPDASTNHGVVPIAEAVSKFDSVGYKSIKIGLLWRERFFQEKPVLIKGRVQEIRANNGKKIYLVVRDKEGSTVRCVLSSVASSGLHVSPEMVKFAARLTPESYVMIEGIVSYSQFIIEGVSDKFRKIRVEKLYCIPNIGVGVDAEIEKALEAERKRERKRIDAEIEKEREKAEIEKALEAEREKALEAEREMAEIEKFFEALRKCGHNSSKPPLADETEFDVEAQNAKRGFQATGRARSCPDLTTQTISCHVGNNGNRGSSSAIDIVIGGAGEIPVNRMDVPPSTSEAPVSARTQCLMDVPPSTSEATVSARTSILSQCLHVSVASVSSALNFIRRLQTSDLGQGFVQMFCLALDCFEAIGTREITKLSFNLFFQMTACLVAYYIYLNSGSSSSDQGSSSATQLSKPLFYSIAATDTVGFLASGVGIAIRDRQLSAGSILGGIGAVLAAATFFLIMSTFISTI